MEAYVVFGALLALALYMLWFIEFKPSLHVRTGNATPDSPKPVSTPSTGKNQA
jgi:hypothetical protein